MSMVSSRRPWRIAAFACMLAKAISLAFTAKLRTGNPLSVSLSHLVGSHFRSPVFLSLFYIGKIVPTFIALFFYLDARSNNLAPRVQIFWAALTVLVAIYTVIVLCFGLHVRL
jgi:hypothetical protein